MGTTMSGSTGPEEGAVSSGVVALLFTDVVGSTRLLDRFGDDATETLRRNHFPPAERFRDQRSGLTGSLPTSTLRDKHATCSAT